MREIKFRVWDPNTTTMYVNIGIDKIHLYDFRGDNISEQEGLEIMQWTGLIDWKGTLIYEGDRLFHEGNLTDELQYVGDVTWNQEDARWEVHNFHGNFAFIPNGCIVQGHIYEEANHEE